MAAVSTIQEINRELATRINKETRMNPQSPYANKFVGIVNGQVVVVADNLDELATQLQLAEPDPGKTTWIEASGDYDKVEYIWGLR